MNESPVVGHAVTKWSVPRCIRFTYHGSVFGGTDNKTKSDVLCCFKRNWNLEFKSRGTGNEYTSVYLNSEFSGQKSTKALVSILMKDGKGGFFEETFQRRYTSYFSHRCLVLSKNDIQDIVAHQDKIEILVTIRIDESVALPKVKDSIKLYCKTKSLEKDMLRLLESGEGSDFTFQFFQTTKNCKKVMKDRIPVHLCILRMRTSSHSAILDCFSKGDTFPINTADADPAAFYHMLRFIYGNAIPSRNYIQSNGMKLLSLADKFDCTAFKTALQAELYDPKLKAFTPDNAADFLLLADALFCGLVKEGVTNYIIKNLKNVQQSAGWARLQESPRLMTELFLHQRSTEADNTSVSDLWKSFDNQSSDLDGSRPILLQHSK